MTYIWNKLSSPEFIQTIPDLTIGITCVLAPLILWLLSRKIKGILLSRWIMCMFSAFAFCNGLNYLLDAANTIYPQWQPLHSTKLSLDGMVWVTLILLIISLPRLLSLHTKAEFEQKEASLRREEVALKTALLEQKDELLVQKNELIEDMQNLSNEVKEYIAAIQKDIAAYKDAN